MTRAFKLNEKVHEQAQKEPALRKEYLKLSEICKRFATDLHNSSKNTEELAALLGLDIEPFRQKCNEKMKKNARTDLAEQLKRAVDAKHLEVCACRCG